MLFHHPCTSGKSLDSPLRRPVLDTVDTEHSVAARISSPVLSKTLVATHIGQTLNSIAARNERYKITDPHWSNMDPGKKYTYIY